MHEFGYTQVASIRYGAWTSDPYYQNNPENRTRQPYYLTSNQFSTPQAWVDGGNHMVGSTTIANQVRGFVQARAAIAPTYAIAQSADLNNNTITITVWNLSDTSPGNKALRVAVVEKVYDWPTPPGTNGQTHYEASMLDMVPNANGTPISIPVGDSLELTLTYNATQASFHPPQDLQAILMSVAFVQNDQTREVLQANVYQGGLELGADGSGALLNPSDNVTFSGFVRNTTETDLNVDMGVSGTIPAGWLVTAQDAMGNPIPADGGVLQTTVPALDSLMYTMTIDPQGNGGGAIVDMDVALTANPTAAGAQNFTISTNDVDVLLVDDDGGDDTEQWILDELTPQVGNLGVISVNSGELAGPELVGIPVVIWNTGIASPTLTAADQAALAEYLDSGGNLFVNGLDIAFELGDPSSPYYTTDSEAFLNTYLHTSYVTRQVSSLIVVGQSGDPLTDGMTVVGLNGGTGSGGVDAGAGRYANEVGAFDASAAVIFNFFLQNTRYAGIRAEHTGTTGNGRVVFTSFPYETIADAGVRNTLATRILAYLTPAVSIDGPGAGVAERFELAQNYPNPFNPTTTIDFAVPATVDNRAVRLVVYDQLGQVVRTLVDGPMTPGRHAVTWDGRNGTGTSVSSGIYFYRLSMGDRVATRKMVLLR